MMQKKIPPFEQTLRSIDHMTRDEHLALAKYLTLKLTGVTLYTAKDIERLIDEGTFYRDSTTLVLPKGVTR